MRMITTWMNFDASEVKGGQSHRRRRSRGEESEPGIGITWCAGDTSTMMSISSIKFFEALDVNNDDFSTEDLRRYIDSFLVDDDDYEFTRPKDPLRNPTIVNYVLTAPFVIEQSPPAHLNLTGVLTKTNMPVWIGTYMGWSVAPEHSVLLFITVPGGIIVVSSAIGLASALAAGLSTSIKRLFRHR